MIESKILGSAPGIQRQDIIDKSETTVLPSLTNGVMTGHFKRGRMDKSFKVTSNNYRALLGNDPSNPSYLAVEDAFKRGISEVSILRIGGTGTSNNLPTPPPTVKCIPSKVEMGLSDVASITASVNGGQRTTFHVSQSDDMQDIMETQAQIFNILTAGDDKSIAFATAMLTNLSYDNQNMPATYLSGIASDGTVDFDNTVRKMMDLGVGGVKNGNFALYQITSIIPIQTTLTFFPTLDAPKSTDFYYTLAGSNDNGDPIVMTSCARAVLGDELVIPL